VSERGNKRSVEMNTSERGGKVSSPPVSSDSTAGDRQRKHSHHQHTPHFNAPAAPEITKGKDI